MGDNSKHSYERGMGESFHVDSRGKIHRGGPVVRHEKAYTGRSSGKQQLHDTKPHMRDNYTRKESHERKVMDMIGWNVMTKSFTANQDKRRDSQ